MPLDKLAPANEDEAHQRLMAVVEQELGRIGRIRAMLQQIADAEQAEAPVRLAFETGTEGDRGRRYLLSYERIVNRRIDTFLKVRKASGSGELDLVELAKTLDPDEFQELTKAAGNTTSQDKGDLRSGDGRGQETCAQQDETRAQRVEAALVGQSPAASHIAEAICDNNLILRNEPNAAACTDADDEDDIRVDCMECGAPDKTIQPDDQIATTEPFRTDEDETTSVVAAATDEFRKEAEVAMMTVAIGMETGGSTAADSCAVSAPTTMSVIDDSLPASSSGQATCDRSSILRNEPKPAPSDPEALEVLDPTRLTSGVETGGTQGLDKQSVESVTESNVAPTSAAEAGPRGDPVAVAPLEATAAADGPVATTLVAGRPPRPCLTPAQEAHNRRLVRYRANRGLSPLPAPVCE